MSFFADFFHSVEKAESIILVDISTGSVAGAYVQYQKGSQPAVLYTRRMPIEVRPDEAQEAAMLRALKVLGDTMLKEGAPVLLRATGSGTAHSILVSIDAPWQKTEVTMQKREEKSPFVFTKGLANEMLKSATAKNADAEYADESIIGTILNGYETQNPYGKRAHRAEIIILTSHIDTRVAKSILATLQGIYHTKKILPIAGDSMRYQVLRSLFPYEKSALLIDATNPLTTIALIRNGLFVSVHEVAPRAVKEPWIDGVFRAFAEIGAVYPLPRTIFLLVHEAESLEVETELQKAELGKLWLSDTPPKIMTVVPSHFSAQIKQVTTAAPDLDLLFMALYWHNRTAEQLPQ